MVCVSIVGGGWVLVQAKKVMELLESLATIRVILTPGDLVFLSGWKRGKVIWLLPEIECEWMAIEGIRDISTGKGVKKGAYH